MDEKICDSISSIRVRTIYDTFYALTAQSRDLEREKGAIELGWFSSPLRILLYQHLQRARQDRDCTWCLSSFAALD